MAAGVTALAYLLDLFTPIDHSFNVVYIVPEGKAAVEAEDKFTYAAGCKLKQMQANSKSLDLHLEEKGLTLVDCTVFDETDKEWVLYARPTGVSLPVAADEQSTTDAPEAPKKKGRYNGFVSNLAGVQLCGPAVVMPADREWKPVVLGRMDMLSGQAGRRQKLESVGKVVTLQALLEVHSQAEGRADASAARILKQVTNNVQGTLHKRRGGGEGEENTEDAPADKEGDCLQKVD